MTSSTTVHSPPRLYGRSGELAILNSLLDRLRRGDGGALVLAAPPGLGRSALLREAAAAHRERGPVLYATAAPAERGLPHSGLRALLRPAPGALTPQALLARLRELGERRPLLVCVDDAHAWDPASRAALGSTAHRLGAGSRVAVLIAADDGPAFAGLPALRLGPLEEDAASALLDRLTRGTEGLDPVVRAELLREAAGNPRLLTGITARLTPDQLTGRTPLPGPLPGAEGVLAAYADRLDGLPAHTRALLLLAAAAQEHEPAGSGADALLLLRAGGRAGLPRDFLDGALFGSAATGGLLQRAGSRVHFSHPLFARAILHHAPPAHRRATHELLAALLTETGDRVAEAPALSTGAGDRSVASPALCAGVADGAEGSASSGVGGGDRAAVSSTPVAVRAGGPATPVVGPDDRPGLPASPSAETGDHPAPLASLVQLSCATPGPDTRLAARLEAAATGPYPHAERSSALARAAALTADRPLRSARFAAAAEQAALAGDPARARALLARTGAAGEHAAAPGLAPYVHGLLALRSGPASDAHEALLAAAALLGPHDPRRALDALLGAAEAAWAAGDAPGYLEAMNRVAPTPYDRVDPTPYAVNRVDPTPYAVNRVDPTPYDRLAPTPYAMNRVDPTPYDRAFASYRDGMRAVLTGRTAEGHAHLRQCLDPADPAVADLADPLNPADRAHRAAGRAVGPAPVAPATADPAALLRAGVAALVLGEVAAACRTGARALAAVRTRGPDALLPQALEHLAYAELRAGLHAGARTHALEGLHAARRTGQPNSSVHLHAVLALAASVEGPVEACAAHCDAALAGAVPHGLTQAATLATWARARADLAAGRPEEAAARLAPLVRPGPRQGHFAARMLALPCYVEAVVGCGRATEEAGELRTAVAEFADWTTRTADPQAPAQLARCRALLAPAGEADARYAEALAHHDRADGDFERARTQLLYGQWLRRRRRTREARGPLRDALVAFQRCSARAWADRAAGELRAAGEQGPAVRPAAGGALAALTPQQQRIARCVAEGATNREVALRLSLSPRTVDHHLRNVFAALGIRSRTELARLLGP
ncbi:AAA family ATPase [Streptomyces sp. cmx-18-6]|uniref:AAA family ATPase n=1 Tax=Streptomyces sp. cmx-18-6 TaxID=2790930 RepID=UPI003980DEED